jgi:hypothetical protein
VPNSEELETALVPNHMEIATQEYAEARAIDPADAIHVNQNLLVRLLANEPEEFFGFQGTGGYPTKRFRLSQTCWLPL